MMNSTFLAVLMVIVAVAALEQPLLTQEHVDRINSIPGLTWKASTKQGIRVGGASSHAIKSMLGYQRRIKNELPRRVFTAAELAAPIPESFDSATQWPQCKTIPLIRDQSACGSCWALAAANSMSDRYCVAGGPMKLDISTANLMECCRSCASSGAPGCTGGNPASAWQYWVAVGLLEEECQPYPFPRCEHHVAPKHYPVCPEDDYVTPECSMFCANKTNKPLKYRGNSSYTLSGEDAFQRELMTYGPFEIAFDVYSDWPAYKSGVYTQTSMDYMGGHTVRLLGWGVLDGVKYWKIANSWNEDWGANGYFLIKRGDDECGIEDAGFSGVVKL